MNPTPHYEHKKLKEIADSLLREVNNTEHQIRKLRVENDVYSESGLDKKDINWLIMINYDRIKSLSGSITEIKFRLAIFQPRIDVLKKMMCDECYGVGELPYGNGHYYECKDCNGSGLEKVEPTPPKGRVLKEYELPK